MLFKKIYIPKNKKKIKKSFFDPKKIINFESKIYNLYNKGKIKYPIHLLRGMKTNLLKYLSILIIAIGYLHLGEITRMHFCMEFLKKN